MKKKKNTKSKKYLEIPMSVIQQYYTHFPLKNTHTHKIQKILGNPHVLNSTISINTKILENLINHCKRPKKSNLNKHKIQKILENPNVCNSTLTTCPLKKTQNPKNTWDLNLKFEQ